MDKFDAFLTSVESFIAAGKAQAADWAAQGAAAMHQFADWLTFEAQGVRQSAPFDPVRIDACLQGCQQLAAPQSKKYGGPDGTLAAKSLAAVLGLIKA